MRKSMTTLLLTAALAMGTIAAGTIAFAEGAEEDKPIVCLLMSKTTSAYSGA